MRLTEEDIASFQALYKKRFGKAIGREEARAQGTQLIELLSLVLKTSDQKSSAENY